MDNRTVYLCRLLGIYCLVIAAAMLARRAVTLDAVTAIVASPALMLLLGVMTLAVGMALVLAHNVWTRGAAALVVTLIGWLSVLKGLMFLAVPPELEAAFVLQRLHYREYFGFYMGITLALGAYLAWHGFRGRR